MHSGYYESSPLLFIHMPFVVIGLGSNVGARESMLDRAVEALVPLVEKRVLSRRYETPALLCADAPKEWDRPFLNMAAAGECTLQPLPLLSALKDIERSLGRKDRGRWAPREIDLDILVYGDVVMEADGLTLPHPELLKRYFALAPLVDVAPDLMIRGKAARQHLMELFP